MEQSSNRTWMECIYFLSVANGYNLQRMLHQCKGKGWSCLVSLMVTDQDFECDSWMHINASLSVLVHSTQRTGSHGMCGSKGESHVLWDHAHIPPGRMYIILMSICPLGGAENAVYLPHTITCMHISVYSICDYRLFLLFLLHLCALSLQVECEGNSIYRSGSVA